ncbi:hypothetical protein C5B91_14480 [Haloferax sp. Atlit-10N]|uniref:Uncharacterized protein n=1 Tax=Haloferax prahovense (strain DSM 18310 / JCM 13924 / TL6) TaxID=1227461 RepID=M0GQ27_HALPT|nr:MULTISPECIES: hypothetical protein [Haloferax]ELZ73678.1 hypothetical protein C457_00285 [Haloferax prahovense DSM 18310]RDZ42680.1 hypothetical protein C5B86_13360 [Haloferax sp. Atlit-19N]RDZ43325.1 hypothetical protein C5B87_15310 [Haloferax sp. Atlit-16N]RDZ57899.1 hypothetical protein C5B91_14480 [Haloferax sp. Atlit-10N]
MRELRTCDFCGTDAVGVFEVLPPELTPADDQRRVVLCEHCEETLSEVIAPLLSRLGVDAGVDVPDDARAETGASAAPERTASGSGGEAASVDVNAVDPAPTPPEPANHDSPDEADDHEESGDDADDDDGEDEAERSDGAARAADETADEPERLDSDAESDADDETETGGDSSDPGEEPPKFRKVIRILQNREFPVERAEVEALASGAYDLEDDEVADIFDYAVERGLLVDDSGTLRRP